MEKINNKDKLWSEHENNKLLEQKSEQKQSKIETLKSLEDYTSVFLSNKGLVNISQIAKDCNKWKFANIRLKALNGHIVLLDVL